MTKRPARDPITPAERDAFRPLPRSMTHPAEPPIDVAPGDPARLRPTITVEVVADFRQFITHEGEISEVATYRSTPNGTYAPPAAAIPDGAALIIELGGFIFDPAQVIRRLYDDPFTGWRHAATITLHGRNAYALAELAEHVFRDGAE